MGSVKRVVMPWEVGSWPAMQSQRGPQSTIHAGHSEARMTQQSWGGSPFGV